MLPIAVDFETEEIKGNPVWHPPKPCGVAIYEKGHEAVYTNDFSVLERFWGRRPMVFHNAPFDLRVAEAWLGLPLPSWDLVHDTQYLLFLDDPYSRSMGLKPAAERYLGMPNDEQNDLVDWIVANVPGSTRKTAGAYISLAPEHLVAPYAKGDVIRTLGLYEKLHPNTVAGPYDRERQLSPILVRASQRGIRVSRAALEEDTEKCLAAIEEADARICAKLGRDINVGSDAELAAALDMAGMVTEWVLTPTGRRSVSKKNIMGRIKDKELEDLIAYRNTMVTCTSTFMQGWLGFSEEDGRLHPEWNQVRDADGKNSSGTRTGRLSCSNPNMQNIPNTLDLPVPEGLPPLPNLRTYLLPEEGHLWLKRDFSSQEVRIAAHFEDGELLQAYRANPRLDPHEMARQMILDITGMDFPRKHVKITGFQILYGGGPNAISGQVGCTYNEAAVLQQAYFGAMPGLRELSEGTKRRGRNGMPIRTWGGRMYYVEPPKLIKGRMRSFEYKLLNYLIQGSAADQTKQCIIDWDHMYNQDAVFLATVHDEINISAPVDVWEREMRGLRRAMDQDYFDCPMMSEGFVGFNWAEMRACE